MTARKSLFSVFFGKSEVDASSRNIAKDTASEDDEEDQIDSGKQSSNEVIDSLVEVGGANGWPTNATVFLYHKVSGMICVGTDGGAVYVYGDGFQFVRPWLTQDPNEVVSIVPLHPNRIMVAFGDNSLVAMELPSLEVVDLLPSSWLPSSYGDISCLHVDMPSEKNFVYLGTSEGCLLVLDVMETMIRPCEYQLSLLDLLAATSSSGKATTNSSNSTVMAIVDLQISPKDDRYLAVGLDGQGEAAVVIFDLVKKKTHKHFPLSSLSSFAWHHNGDVLFAGTRDGLVYSINVEKGSSVNSWTAADEKIDDDDDEDDNNGNEEEDDEGGNRRQSSVSIRRVSWLAPQRDSDEDGCLFVLLGTGAADNDNLKNVILGLQPSSSHSHGHGQGQGLGIIFALPPLTGEKIVNFRVIPTVDKASLISRKCSSHEVQQQASPGLLMLTQRQDENDRSVFEKQLRAVRCPKGSLGPEWAIEIGTMAEARQAVEVQPSASDITVIVGTVPVYSNPLSLSQALIAKAAINCEVFNESDRNRSHSHSHDHDSVSVVSTSAAALSPAPSNPSSPFNTHNSSFSALSKANANSRDNRGDNSMKKASSKRLSYRAFLDQQAEMEAMADAAAAEERDGWEMVLVSGEHEETIPPATSNNNHNSSNLSPGAGGGGNSLSALTLRKEDVVLLGHSDGTVLAFGVSRPNGQSSAEIGRGGIWLPLTALRLGLSPVTTIAVEEDYGLLFLGDETGCVALYQVYDEEMRLGAVDMLLRLQDKLTSDADLLASDTSTTLGIDDFSSEQTMRELRTFSTGCCFAGVKETIHTQLTGGITSALIVGEFMLLFVGTEDGAIMVNSDLRSSLFAAVDSNLIASTGACGAVKGLSFGYYLYQGTLIAAVYAYFESGHCLVIEVSSMAVIAFNVVLKAAMAMTADSHYNSKEQVAMMDMFLLAAKDEEEDAEEEHRLQLCKKPTLLAHYYCAAKRKITSENNASSRSVSMDSAASDSTGGSFQQPAPVSSETAPPKPQRISFFSRAKTAPPAPSSSSSPLPPSASSPLPPQPPAAAATVSAAIEAAASKAAAMGVMQHDKEDVPSTLVLFLRHSLVSMSIDKFFAVNVKRRESLATLAKNAAGVSVRKICEKRIVSSNLLQLYYEDPSDSFAYLGCVDEEGTFRLVSLSSRRTVSHSSLLQGITDESAACVHGGLTLGNGSNYLLQRGAMIYSSYVSFKDCRMPLSPPDRANPSARPVKPSLALKHGREAAIAKLRNDAKKRRSSIMTLSSAPTDLYKVFAKTRDQRLRDDFNKGLSSESSDPAQQQSIMRRSQQSAGSVKSDMEQVRANFAERDERINRLALKMTDFKDSAAQFKQQARAQKEQLKQRNRTWGMF